MTIRTAQRLPLVQFEIDRDHVARARPDLIDELWADADTRVLPLWNGSAPIDPATSLQLSALDTGLFIEALSITNWHRNHEFSARSGEPTRIDKAGWVRVDPGNAQHFPRTDPAIIVAVTDGDDRLLLGSNAMWANNRYSLLAGFVEPGESLEDAVVREVFEESGVRVTDPQYLGSQPWPFPASLMLGFSARVDESWSGKTQPDGEEILDLRWFSRDELRDAMHQVLLPGPASISRLLIEHWYGSELDDGSRG